MYVTNLTNQRNLSEDKTPVVLAIDTSCDETAAAVTKGTNVWSNIIWSQAASHAQFGGVMPALAQRMHRERIDWVVDRAVQQSRVKIEDIEIVAVTSGPGLAIALEVGINKAKELAGRLKLPLVEINHTEGHLLSPLAKPREKPLESLGQIFPALGLVVSGGHTELVTMTHPGEYKILAKTQDDALGEALDKAARMLGLGYPGGAILEKMARRGNPKACPLPLPMARQGTYDSFSYSGLKTAFYRMTNGQNPDKQSLYDFAASFQNRAFQHLERVISFQISELQKTLTYKGLLAGGGVIANTELRSRLRKICRFNGLRLLLPYSTRLTGDNAAMIGVAAAFKKTGIAREKDFSNIDRKPKWSVENV